MLVEIILIFKVITMFFSWSWPYGLNWVVSLKIYTFLLWFLKNVLLTVLEAGTKFISWILITIFILIFKKASLTAISLYQGLFEYFMQ